MACLRGDFESFLPRFLAGGVCSFVGPLRRRVVRGSPRSVVASVLPVCCGLVTGCPVRRLGARSVCVCAWVCSGVLLGWGPVLIFATTVLYSNKLLEKEHLFCLLHHSTTIKIF